MKYQITSRWDSSKILFEAEIECSADASEGVKLGLAVRAAVKARANLARANLADANLARAYLADAYLADANLAGAYLADANLAGANLADANLAGANLADANLARADLYDEQLRPFKADLWTELTETRAHAEVPGLIQALREGRVDGSKYEGECCCLVGTLANIRGVSFQEFNPNSDRPSERWFMMIRQGDKAGDKSGGGYAAQKAVEWCLEYCELTGIEVPAVEATP